MVASSKGRVNLDSVRLGKTVLHIGSDVDPSRSPFLKTIDRKSFERGNFLVLHPGLLKIAYFKSAN